MDADGTRADKYKSEALKLREMLAIHDGQRLSSGPCLGAATVAYACIQMIAGT